MRKATTPVSEDLASCCTRHARTPPALQALLATFIVLAALHTVQLAAPRPHPIVPPLLTIAAPPSRNSPDAAARAAPAPRPQAIPLAESRCDGPPRSAQRSLRARGSPTPAADARRGAAAPARDGTPGSLPPECRPRPAQPLALSDAWGALPAALADYAASHAAWRVRLASACGPGNASARGSACMPEPAPLVWARKPLRVCCGLGDRLSSLLSTFLMAVATGRPFFAEWGDEFTPFALQVGLAPGFVDWQLPPRLLSGAASYKNMPMCNWAKGFPYVVRNATAVTCSGSGVAGVHDLTKPGGVKAAFGGPKGPALRHYSRFAINSYLIKRHDDLASLPDVPEPLRRLARESGNDALAKALFTALFRVADGVWERADVLGFPLFGAAAKRPGNGPRATLNARIRRPIAAQPVRFVAAHVRAGRDVGESSAGMRRFDWAAKASAEDIAEAVLKCALRFAAVPVGRVSRGGGGGVGNLPNVSANVTDGDDCGNAEGGAKGSAVGDGACKVVVYIASDSQDVKRAAAQIAPRLGARVLMQTGRRAAHLADPALDGSDVGRGGLLACQQYLDMFVDIAMLSAADRLVSTGSTFSDVAFHAARRGAQMLVVPSKLQGRFDCDSGVRVR